MPAPGKLRDPASQYWSIQHSGHNGEWPWPGERTRDTLHVMMLIIAGVPASAAVFPGHDGQYSPVGAWYGGPGGGESSSPPARTNGNNTNNNGHSSNSSSSRTGTPTTTSAPNDWSSEGSGGSNGGGGGVAPVSRLQAGATCTWEWWPPDPPEEWALSPAHPWEPPPAPGPGHGPAPLNGYGHTGLAPLRHETPANGHDGGGGHHGERSGVW